MGFGAGDPRPKGQQGPTLNNAMGGGETWQEKEDRFFSDWRSGAGQIGDFLGNLVGGSGGLPGPKINMPDFPGPKVNLPGPTVGQVWDALYSHFTGPTQKLLGRDKKKGGVDDSAIPAAGAGGEDTGTTTPASDPNALALQMFFSSTIAPYLNQLAGQMKESGANYATALQGVQGQLNPAVLPYFNPAARQAQVNQQANAMAATAVAAPQLDQLLSSINQAAEMQRFLAYQEMQNRANSQSGGLIAGLLGAVGGGGGGDAEQLTKLLSGEAAK